MADSKVDAISELSDKRQNKTFECCKTKTVSIAVCIKCGKTYHRSCLERKNYSAVDETRIICCEKSTSKTSETKGYLVLDDEETQSTHQSNAEVSALQKEIQLLIKIIAEKDAKYALIVENKKLLEEKITFLLDENKKLQTLSTDKSNKNISVKRQETTGSTIITNHTKKDISQKSHTADNLLENKINNNEEQIKHGVQKTNQNNDANNSDTEFTVVQTRKQKRNTLRSSKKMIGKSDEENKQGFKGIEPKAWIYLYRVLGNVEDIHIKDYLEDKLGKDSDYAVTELKSNVPNKKCFMVGVNFSFKDKLYEPSFWPKGVGFRRFNFAKYNLYQQSASPSNFV